MGRADELMKSAEERRGHAPQRWLRFMADVDPDFLEAYDDLYGATSARGVHVSLKFQELVTIAALAVRREDFGMRAHVKRAYRLGATTEEIVETLQTACVHTGALTLAHGLRVVLDVLDELHRR